MFPYTASGSLRSFRSAQIYARRSASRKTILEADTGPWATRIHHTAMVLLGVGAPIYYFVPDTMSDTKLNKAFGVAVSGFIAFHSWIGLNYVAADYVPKVSKALLPPTRFAIAGMCAITFLGMAKASVYSPGGLKGIIKGPWSTKKSKDAEF
ncbi:hypothetical protein MPSEU_000521800 [Mayamaea pseudoterrestris]|nr:hypothetical protein MPSEU_000521800 [Mayamaea pseudoterrestris]